MPDQQRLWQNELLTVPEVAAYLRVTRVTVWRWCQQGTIPASRIGRNWRIHRSELLHLLETSHFAGPDCAPLNITSQKDKEGNNQPLSADVLEQEDSVEGIVANSGGSTDSEGTHD